MAKAISRSLASAFCQNFLGNAPVWYKLLIVLFLIINPILYSIHPFAAGWLLILEFIFTLAMSLTCYPLQPGGLLAIEAVAIGMTTPDVVYHEVGANLPVILLLMFMVAGIHFVRSLLLFVFSKVIIGVRSKMLCSLIFSVSGAFLSAFLDALTVLAVFISICIGFYGIYHKVVSSSEINTNDDSEVPVLKRDDLNKFRAYLRSILMHAAVGTALGGVCTIVGEPQNLIIGAKAQWHFSQFFLRMVPVSLPVLICGIITCLVIEKLKLFGYGTAMPETVRQVLIRNVNEKNNKMSKNDVAKLIVQGICCIWLILGLALHLAEVGLIGLTVIILATASCGVVSENKIGKAFTESLPFCALLCVFFSIIGVISHLKLFDPIMQWVFSFEDPQIRTSLLFAANGVLSAVSDNVFVGTLYIDQTFNQLVAGNIDREHFDMLAIAINAGTNLPSVATPNGQAAFLFLLTSSLAPLIRLSYTRMMWMALPYTIVLCIVSYLCVVYVAPDATIWMEDHGVVARMTDAATLAEEAIEGMIHK
ncbi:MAG: sodium/proton antiporter NhaB [Succinivibrionaceae bacterium]